MVFYIRVRDVNGIGCEKRDWVDLEEGSYLGDFKVSVESVAKKSIA